MRISTVDVDNRTAFLMSQLFAKIIFESVIANAKNILEERNEYSNGTDKSEIDAQPGHRD